MTAPSPRLSGRTALVTGGASGIGRATLFRLLEEGAVVVFTDVNLDTGTATLQAARDTFDPDRVRFFPGDAAAESDVEHAVRFVQETFGRIDCLAGCAGTGGALSGLLETSADLWDRTQELLGRSVFLGLKHAGRAMVAQGRGGSVVNVSSVAALAGGHGSAAYSAAKAAVSNLGMTAAVELAQHRIRVNTVSPAGIATPLLVRGGDAGRMRAASVATQPWPQAGEAEDVAACIAFLLSDDARFVTGADLAVDGGLSVQGGFRPDGGNPMGREIVAAIRRSGAAGLDRGSTVPSATDRSWLERLDRADAVPPSLRDRRRVVLLTGATRGLGRALAERLAGMGHVIAGCGRNREAVEEMNRRFDRPHRFEVVDVASHEAVARWLAELDRADLVPDLVVNNAALTNAPTQLWRLGQKEIEDVLRVNVAGTMNVLRQIVPVMFRRRRGILVNFSSGWGREAAARTSAYCASKWAVEGLTRALAAELPGGMAVVAVHPGIVRTDTMARGFGEAADLYPSPAQWASIAAPYLLGITPQDNGRSLSVPGMTAFHGMGRVDPQR